MAPSEQENNQRNEKADCRIKDLQIIYLIWSEYPKYVFETHIAQQQKTNNNNNKNWIENGQKN